MNIYSKIFADMNFMLFQVIDSNNFKKLDTIPDWFQTLYNERIITEEGAEKLLLSEAFPYIGHILNEEQAQENTPSNQLFESGVWTEENDQGDEYQFYAYLYNDQGNKYLILENRTPRFSEQQQVFQKARDIALVNEKLIQEINFNQRLLQNDIANKIVYAPHELKNVINETNSAVMICDDVGHVEVVNQALIDIYQLNDKNQLSKTSLLEQWVAEAEEQYPEIKTVLKKGANWEGEFETTDLLGVKKWIRLTIRAVYSDESPLSQYICIANNIDEFKKSHDGMIDDRTTDLITQLPNRKLFWENFQQILEHAKNHNEDVALIIIDLDYFKQINNNFGHNSGDFLLKIIAKRIVEKMKRMDFISHLGGDEFAIIARGVSRIKEIEEITHRLNTTINLPLVLDNQSIRVTCSMGSALFPKHGSNEKELMKHADLAMYYAKELGRNQHQFYNERLEQVKFRIERDKELNDALENNQFFLEYQPQVCLLEDKKFRLEALIRWQHPETGLISPAEFIDSAERSGLIVPIGRWVLHQACSEAKNLYDKDIDVVIAVNVSSKQLKHSSFFNMVKNSLETIKLPAHCLEIEITESAFLDGIENIIPKLKQLRDIGVSISLDDFGSGFSSFNYLRKLPLDILKIDRTFIMELESSEDSQVIATMIIKLAKALNLKVVAEGVETQKQLDFMVKQNCDIVQGYYFSRPLPANKLIDIYTNSKFTSSLTDKVSS